jgi:hypothetical protein
MARIHRTRHTIHTIRVIPLTGRNRQVVLQNSTVKPLELDRLRLRKGKGEALKKPIVINRVKFYLLATTTRRVKMPLMKPKLLGLSLASSALLATVAHAGQVTADQVTERVTIPSDTLIQKAQITPSGMTVMDDDSPNHQSHASHSSHTSHYSSGDSGQ